MKNNKKKGFTLIELIAVIAILAILGFILVPNILGYRAKAEKANIQSSAKTLLNAFRAYNSDKDEADKIGKAGSYAAGVTSLKDESLIDSKNIPKCLSDGTNVTDLDSLESVANGSFKISTFSGQDSSITILH